MVCRYGMLAWLTCCSHCVLASRLQEREDAERLYGAAPEQGAAAAATFEPEEELKQVGVLGAMCMHEGAVRRAGGWGACPAHQVSQLR